MAIHIEPMSADELKSCFPAHMRKNVTTELLDEVNGAIADPYQLEAFKQNMVNFASVMQQGKFKMSEYINAVRYVTFKAMGQTNTEAYINAFPDRYKDHITHGCNSNTIQSYITSYNKSKLVTLILAQTIIPSYILNQGLYQEGLRKLNALMNNAKSELVQYNAAAKLVDVLRPPEVKKLELNIGVSEDSPLKQVEQSLAQIAQMQLEMIKNKQLTAKDVAELPILKDVQSDEVI